MKDIESIEITIDLTTNQETEIILSKYSPQFFSELRKKELLE